MAISYLPYNGTRVTRAEAIKICQKRYFTSVPCPRGHISQRVVSSRACVSCQEEYRNSVPKSIKNSYAAKWRKINSTSYHESQENFRIKHQQRRNLDARKRYAENKEKERARVKLWREKNPEGVRAHAMTRLALKKGSSGSYTYSDVQDLYDLQKGNCLNCLISLKGKFHVDHIQPISRGGMNVRSNLQILCAPCNLSKHALDPFEWAQRNGRLL